MGAISSGSTAGAAVTISGNFANTGTLGVDEYNFFGSAGGSTLTITGTLTNSGSVFIGNSFQHGIQTTASATLNVGTLASTGLIVLQGDTTGKATLDVTGGAAPATLSSTLRVDGN